MIYEFNNLAININNTVTSIWYEESQNKLYIARNIFETNSFFDITIEEFNEVAKKIVEENSNIIFISRNDLLNVNNMVSYKTINKNSKVSIELTVIVDNKYQRWVYPCDELQLLILVKTIKEACNREIK